MAKGHTWAEHVDPFGPAIPEGYRGAVSAPSIATFPVV